MNSTILMEIASRHGLKSRSAGARFVGPCPKCGGSKDSDKFVLKDDGGFKCYACDFKGDIITWMREIENLTCPEAHERAEVPCRAESCQVRGTCRMGDGSGRRPASKKQSVTPPAPLKEATIPVVVEKSPAEIWQTWASSLVKKATAAIQKNPEVLSWLAARGIDAGTAATYRLGWLGHQRKANRSEIGLPPKGEKNTLWIPDGLLIPIFGGNGEIHRLRIRRPDASRDQFLPDLKYVWIEGSGNLPLVLRPAGKPRGVMIVEAELDAYAVAGAHEQLLVIAIGSVSAGIPADLAAEIAEIPTILITLDADPGKGSKQGPGPAAVKKWTAKYRQAKFWPVPVGKDPGDYAKTGASLRPWIESGLIPEIKTIKNQDPAFTPGSIPSGVSGKEIPALQQESLPVIKAEATGAESSPYDACASFALLDGATVYVTRDEAAWHHLTLAGEIVFSENELIRLKEATKSMTPDESAQAAMQMVKIKRTIPAAYVRAGRQIQGEINA
jgi:hypothetical protein